MSTDFDLDEQPPAPPKPLEQMDDLDLAHWLLSAFVARATLHEFRSTELTEENVDRIRAWTLARLDWEAEAIERPLVGVDLRVRALGRELEFDIVPKERGALAIGVKDTKRRGRLK